MISLSFHTLLFIPFPSSSSSSFFFIIWKRKNNFFFFFFTNKQPRWEETKEIKQKKRFNGNLWQGKISFNNNEKKISSLVYNIVETVLKFESQIRMNNTSRGHESFKFSWGGILEIRVD